MLATLYDYKNTAAIINFKFAIWFVDHAQTRYCVNKICRKSRIGLFCNFIKLKSLAVFWEVESQYFHIELISFHKILCFTSGLWRNSLLLQKTRNNPKNLIRLNPSLDNGRLSSSDWILNLELTSKFRIHVESFKTFWIHLQSRWQITQKLSHKFGILTNNNNLI